MRRSIYRAITHGGRALEAPGPLQRIAQQELDVPVQRAQVIVRPSLNGIEQVLVDSQEKWLALGHGAAAYE